MPSLPKASGLTPRCCPGLSLTPRAQGTWWAGAGGPGYYSLLPCCELIGLRALGGHGRGRSWSTGTLLPLLSPADIQPRAPDPQCPVLPAGQPNCERETPLLLLRRFPCFYVGPLNTVQLGVLLSSVSISFPRSLRLGCCSSCSTSLWGMSRGLPVTPLMGPRQEDSVLPWLALREAPRSAPLPAQLPRNH